MTSEEFKQVRQTIWRTQAEAADALGVTEGAVAHWEHGRRKVPGIVLKLMECLEKTKGEPVPLRA